MRFRKRQGLSSPNFVITICNLGYRIEDGSSRGETQNAILGIGNLLMGDEGVGVHAARRLEQDSWPPEVSVVDGGTGGFHLLSYFQDYDRITPIDATMDGRSSGTLSTLQPRFASDFPRSLSAHNIGLRDLIESASLLRPFPEIFLITVSIDEMQAMTTELSPPRCLESSPEYERSQSELLVIWTTPE